MREPHPQHAAPRVLDGRFLIRRRLGGGAASDVYEATVLKDTDYASRATRVAIKSYKPWVLDQPDEAIRLERELTKGLSIESKHVMRAYELVQDNGLHLVMEFLDGPTLTEWMQANPVKRPGSRSLNGADPESRFRILGALAAGLEALHSKGIIHRDIKPDNVMVLPDRVVITDLGVIKDVNAKTATVVEKFLGTIRYSAPEYLFHESYDSRVDVYGLGAIAHELATGFPLISDLLPWSVQVLRAEDPDDLIDSDHFHEDFFRAYGWRRGLFLRSLLYFTTCDDQSRITSGQVAEAFRKRAWEGWFAPERVVWEQDYRNVIDYLYQWREEFSACWPRIPAKYEPLAKSLAGKRMPPKEVLTYLIELAFATMLGKSTNLPIPNPGLAEEGWICTGEYWEAPCLSWAAWVALLGWSDVVDEMLR